MLIVEEARHALGKVFTDPIRWVQVVLFSVVIFLLFILIPVWSTPGNDFMFQITLLEPFVLFLFILLSLSNGLLVTMQLYIRREAMIQVGRSGRAMHGATAFGILISSLGATFACAACYSFILAFLGVGAVAFLVKYQVLIALGALSLTSYAIYHSGRRINNNCSVCKA